MKEFSRLEASLGLLLLSSLQSASSSRKKEMDEREDGLSVIEVLLRNRDGLFRQTLVAIAHSLT